MCSWVDWWLAGSSQTMKREKGYKFTQNNTVFPAKYQRSTNIKNNNKNEISNKILL